MPAYEFVVSSGAPKPANKAVRSHAMRTALELRARHTGSQPQGSVDSQRTRELKDGLKGRFRLSANPKRGRERHKRPNKTPQPSTPQSGSAMGLTAGEAALVLMLAGDGTSGVQWFGSGFVDPFGTLPVPSNWRVDMLVKYFLTRFSLNITTVDKQRPWFSYAMSDPLVMNVTLALSAAFWSTGTCKASIIVKREGIYQKGEAIKTINTLLEDLTVTDTVIAAVANLGNIAALEGQFEEADVHVRGLQKLLELRGGAEAFRDVFYIARAINWVDVQIASGLGRKPLFPLIHGLEDVRLPESVTREAETPSLSQFDDLGQAAETLKSIFPYLRQAILCRKYRIAAPNGIRVILNVAEFHILDHIEDEAHSPRDHRFKTLILAAHVFLYAGLRQLPPMGALIRIMLDRLRDALGAGEIMAETWRDHLSDLLWVLSVGAAASPKDRYETGLWFSSRLELVLRLLQIRTRTALEAVLQRYVWADEYGHDFLGMWWKNFESDARGPPPCLRTSVEALCQDR